MPVSIKPGSTALTRMLVPCRACAPVLARLMTEDFEALRKMGRDQRAELGRDEVEVRLRIVHRSSSRPHTSD